MATLSWPRSVNFGHRHRLCGIVRVSERCRPSSVSLRPVESVWKTSMPKPEKESGCLSALAGIREDEGSGARACRDRD
jgi:hypothetical protein